MLEEWSATDVGAGTPGDREVAVPGKPDSLAGTDAVRYVTTVDDPCAEDEDVAVLHLNGVYARAEVEVTGDIVGGDGPITHDRYFEPLRIPFRPDTDGETRIAVTCHAPDDRFGGLHDTERVPETEAVPGIWWDASLETGSLPFVADVQVRPELTDDGAMLHVRTTVVTDGPLDDRITYSLKPTGELQTRGMMDRGTITADGPGATTVEHDVPVRDPALWWPRGYGDQHRYTLRAKLGDSERGVTTGICRIERDGSDFLVNGEPVPVRGVNVTTADPSDVERAIEVNATVLRAHAQVLPPSVYEACDEAGLLVWQDLPLTGPGSFDVDRGRGIAAAIGERYARHPSLAAFAVHDEPTATFADGLGSGLLDRLRFRWRTWRASYDRSDADAVAAALPDGRPVVPVVGTPGIDADAGAYFPGWDYGSSWDVDDTLDRFPTEIVAEFGAGALGSQRVDSAADFDAEKHDIHVEADSPSASQAYQADCLRRVGATVRQRGLGAIAYSLRDTDEAGLGVYERDGTPKEGRDALARTFEPIQAFLAHPTPGATEVVVVNDTPTARTGTLRWEAGDDGDAIEFTVNETGRWTGGPVDIPTDADTVTLTVVTSGRTVENRYDL